MKLYVNDGKTKEDLLNKCLTELNVSVEDIYYNISEKESGLFKTKKYQIEAIEKKEVNKFIKIFLKDLVNKMGLEANLEIRESEGIINIQLISDNNPILIGKDGRTINALQLLLRQALTNNFKFNIKANLDVSNYKSKKLKRIEYEIKKIAYEVQNSHIDAILDPMNSFERRQIHSMISSMNNLETESYGEGLERHIVIKYVEDKLN